MTLTTLLLIWAVVASVMVGVFGYFSSKFAEIADQWREKHLENQTSIDEAESVVRDATETLSVLSDECKSLTADRDNWKHKYRLLVEDHNKALDELKEKSQTIEVIANAVDGHKFIRLRGVRTLSPRVLAENETDAATEPEHTQWTATVPEMGSIDCTCKELLAGQYHQPGCPIVEVNGMEVVENV